MMEGDREQGELRRRSSVRKQRRRTMQELNTMKPPINSSQGSDDVDLDRNASRRKSTSRRRRSDQLPPLDPAAADRQSGSDSLGARHENVRRSTKSRRSHRHIRRRSGGNSNNYPDLLLIPGNTPRSSRSSQGSIGSDGSADSSGYRAAASSKYKERKAKEELARDYLNTKAGMLEVIEGSLQLRLEMRSIKEHFLQLLENFTRYEEVRYNVVTVNRESRPNSSQQISIDSSYQAPQVSMCSPHTDKTTDNTSELSRHDDNGEVTSASRNTDMYPFSSASDSAFFPFRSSNYMVRKRRNVYEDANLTNVSEITRSSEISMMRAEKDPLQSTFQYPQSSTPEKSDQSLAPETSVIHKLTLLGVPESAPANNLDSMLEPSVILERVRPTPTGLDNAHFNLVPPQSSAAQALLNVSPGQFPNTPTRQTPVMKNALQANPNLNYLVSNNHSGTAGMDSTAQSPTLLPEENSANERTPRVSRELFLQTEETFSIPSRRLVDTPSDSDISYGLNRMRRQTGRDNVSDSMLATAHMDLTDNTFGDSTLANTAMFSMEATRGASIPNLGSLTDILSDDDDDDDDDDDEDSDLRSSDYTMSTQPSNNKSYTTTESSYKESDGQWSPGRSANTGSYVSMPEPATRLDGARKVGPPSSGTNSLASLNSDKAGFRAPVNSPNATDNSTSLSSNKPTTMDSDQSDYFRPVRSRGRRPLSLTESILMSPPHILGVRPPCIGDELHTPTNIHHIYESISSATPSTVKRKPPKRTSSLKSPKPIPMASVEPKSLTDCDSSSEKSTSTAECISKSSVNASKEAAGSQIIADRSGESRKDQSGSRSLEVPLPPLNPPSTPAKKVKRRLSQKIKSIKDRFRRRSTTKPNDDVF